MLTARGGGLMSFMKLVVLSICLVSTVVFALVPTTETFEMKITGSKHTPIIYYPSCDSYGYYRNEILPNSFRPMKIEVGLNGNPLSMTLQGVDLETPTCAASLPGFPSLIELLPFESKEFILQPLPESEFATIKLTVKDYRTTIGPSIRSDCEYTYKCTAAGIIGYDYLSIDPGLKTPPIPEYCALACDCYAPAIDHVFGIVESEGSCPIDIKKRRQLLEVLTEQNVQKCDNFQEIHGVVTSYSKELLNCKKNYNW